MFEAFKYYFYLVRFHLRLKFNEYGNQILAAIILVTCPCDLLYEQLKDITQQSTKLSTQMTWLNIIRPDWFDINYEMRLQVQTYLIIKNIIETRENRFFNDTLIQLVLENTELDSYRSVIIHYMMKYEQWTWIELFVKYEHDWSFLHTQSTKVEYL
jgi:hypothetical protein